METPASPALSFERLVSAIGQAHAELVTQASRAVNTSLTVRNWLIGFHIAEYEQQGTDRAQYGDKLLERLSDRLVQAGVSRAEARESLTPELKKALGSSVDAFRREAAEERGNAALHRGRSGARGALMPRARLEKSAAAVLLGALAAERGAFWFRTVTGTTPDDLSKVRLIEEDFHRLMFETDGT